MALDDIFLVDIAHKRDLVATPSGDIATISGKENLRGALYRRLITVPGSVIHRPNYGVGVALFQNTLARLSKQQELALLVKEQFEQDDRVIQVNGVQFIQDAVNPHQWTIYVRVQPVAIDEQTMSFTPFGDA